jgi:hypothetical protein
MTNGSKSGLKVRNVEYPFDLSIGNSCTVSHIMVTSLRSKWAVGPGSCRTGLAFLKSYPSRTGGRIFLHHFPVRQPPDTGLLSLRPFLLRPPGYGGQTGTSPLRTILTLKLSRPSSYKLNF